MPGGIKTKKLLIFAVLAISLIALAGAANYMYEKASVRGVGYKNVEMIISTQTGFNGQKLVEKESGSGNVITERTELEAERQLTRTGEPIGAIKPIPSVDFWVWGPCQWPTGMRCPMDYINFTKEAEFEYMPVSYQTGTYDQKWIEKLCVQNYRIGAVLTEMYTHAEHLQKTTEVKTRGYSRLVIVDLDNLPVLAFDNFSPNVSPSAFLGEGCPACCTGVLEANLNSNVIGVAHIGWLSRDPQADNQLKGRHAEYGRSVEDLTGVFSIEKFIQLWGNSTCGAISVDWLPCV
ncbi:MAG: hypothetical protein MUE87_00355 [Methanothrix sp.]|jgi:hypothetical protein|nr:hypothetical protein [Methanothrix sp.]